MKMALKADSIICCRDANNWNFFADGNAKWYNHRAQAVCSSPTDKEIKSQKFDLAREHIANSNSDLIQDTNHFPTYHTIKRKVSERYANTIHREE